MYDDGLRRVLLKTHTLDELDRVIEQDMKSDFDSTPEPESEPLPEIAPGMIDA